jgi:hypothetical protein
VTKDHYLRIARESGASEFKDGNFAWLFYETEIIAFASTIAALEREECAKLCTDMQDKKSESRLDQWNTHGNCEISGYTFAEAIRNKDTK